MSAMRFEQGIAFPFPIGSKKTGIKGGRIICFREENKTCATLWRANLEKRKREGKENAKSYN